MDNSQKCALLVSVITLIVTSASLYKTHAIQVELVDVTSANNVVQTHCKSIDNKDDNLQLLCRDIAKREIEKVHGKVTVVVESNDTTAIQEGLYDILVTMLGNKNVDWSSEVETLRSSENQAVHNVIQNDALLSSYFKSE